MADNLKAAAFAAGLSPEEQKRIDEFNKSLTVHKQLSNLPADVANKVYNQQTSQQQANLVQNFGNEDPAVKQKRGWLGTAFHYTFGTAGNILGEIGSKTLAGLNNVSDVMTRAYRTGAIAIDQGKDIATAWDIANDKGDKVFSPSRIADAKAKFGSDAVDVATRIASGEKPEKIMATATPDQVKFVMLASPNNMNIPGFASPEDVKAARALFQDTLDAVNAAKYSPGRFIANLVTPAQLEGSGLFYKAVSGAVDAAYRIIADPLLIAGKAKRGYDVTKYALDVAIGKGNIAEVFSRPSVINFWDQYGAKLDELSKAQTAKNPEEILRIKKDLQIMAPELGPAVQQSFMKSKIPVTNAKTAQAFFENAKQLDETLKGGLGRQRVIIPRMDPLRKARIAAVTTGRKVLNLDAVGPKLVDDMWFGGATDADGIAKTIIDGKEEFVNKVKASTNPKDVARFSTAYIQKRIDRAKAKFTIAPLFQDDVFDVTAADAGEKIYRLAILVMPKRESKLLSEAFNSIEEVGKKKDVYYGLWDTIAEIRGLKTNAPGDQITRLLTGKNRAVFGLEDAYRNKGALPSDFNSFVSAPSLKDIDLAASRNGLFQRMIGIANSELANKMVGAWSFLTLAGPRYALRNAGEDLMVNLAIGESPWGIAKSRMLATRINTYLAAAQKAEGKLTWVNNPLGIAMRLVNKKDVDRYASELTKIKKDFDATKNTIADLNKEIRALPKNDPNIAVKQAEIDKLSKKIQGGLTAQTREVFARALNEGRINRYLTSIGKDPLFKEDLDILSEQLKYGNVQDSFDVVGESASNYATGNDLLSRAKDLEKKTGVRVHALEIADPEVKLVKKPGERSFDKRAISVQDEASMYAWMSQIGYYANDDLGKIAVANLDDNEKFMKEARKWLQTKDGQKYVKDARLSNDMSSDEVLNLAFTRTKDLFSKQNKDLNLDLLNKVRYKDKYGNYQVGGKLSIDDLPTSESDIPAAIVGPTLVPAVDLDQMTSSVMTNGWTFLGLSNARMSRQPMVLNEMIKIRKEMRKAGFEDKYIEAHTKGIDPKNTTAIEIATRRGKEALASIVEERAVGQILQYVDNPTVRTQLAFSARNFARFYRATEDFYRRMYRVVRYNPEAIVKAALTYEGVTHSGWIQKDDQGNDYFVYPGIGPVYNAVQKTLDKLGIGNEFKIPFPIEFGANLKMVTPSLNPDSLVPTFSGPLAGASVTVVSGLVGIFNPGAADTIKGYALGKYSVDQPILSAFMPAHINRLLASMNTDERNSQYASAWRKAVTYLEAAGHGLPEKYDEAGNLIPPTPAEQEAYRIAVKNTTLGILRVRFALGFLVPASPQVQLKSDMAQWISDNGRASWKQAWNKLLEQYPGDYDAAMKRWVELYPNEVPYTITESERKSIAPLRYAEEAGYFVDQNKELFKDYPSAAAFLIPHKSGFSWDAYKTMKDMGLTYNKRVDDYLRDVQTASDLQTYFQKKDEYEAGLKSAGMDYARTQLRKQFDQWKTVFFAGHPLVQEELAQGSQKAITRLQTLDELNNMLSQNLNIAPKTEAQLREMSSTYQRYRDQRANYEQFGGNDQLIKMLKESTIIKLRELAAYNENTQAAYDVLFGRLLGD